jgi:hypothetical protein
MEYFVTERGHYSFNITALGDGINFSDSQNVSVSLWFAPPLTLEQAREYLEKTILEWLSEHGDDILTREGREGARAMIPAAKEAFTDPTHEAISLAFLSFMEKVFENPSWLAFEWPDMFRTEVRMHLSNIYTADLYDEAGLLMISGIIDAEIEKVVGRVNSITSFNEMMEAVVQAVGRVVAENVPMNALGQARTNLRSTLEREFPRSIPDRNETDWELVREVNEAVESLTDPANLQTVLANTRNAMRILSVDSRSFENAPYVMKSYSFFTGSAGSVNNLRRGYITFYYGTGNFEFNDVGEDGTPFGGNYHFRFAVQGRNITIMINDFYTIYDDSQRLFLFGTFSEDFRSLTLTFRGNTDIYNLVIDGGGETCTGCLNHPCNCDFIGNCIYCGVGTNCTCQPNTDRCGTCNQPRPCGCNPTDPVTRCMNCQLPLERCLCGFVIGPIRCIVCPPSMPCVCPSETIRCNVCNGETCSCPFGGNYAPEWVRNPPRTAEEMRIHFAQNQFLITHNSFNDFTGLGEIIARRETLIVLTSDDGSETQLFRVFEEIRVFYLRDPAAALQIYNGIGMGGTHPDATIYRSGKWRSNQIVTSWQYTAHPHGGFTVMD